MGPVARSVGIRRRRKDARCRRCAVLYEYDMSTVLLVSQFVVTLPSVFESAIVVTARGDSAVIDTTNMIIRNRICKLEFEMARLYIGSLQ